ncbi:MAG TPA: signal peptidase II [Anaerolineaceae bacterium]|nr:signal peptidase II [Anaerolineaceae bacterium]
MKQKTKSNLMLVLIALVVIALDQLTKRAVQQNLALGEALLVFPPWDFVRIVHWVNTGAAFGIFQGGNAVLIGLTAAITLAILVYYQTLPEDHLFQRICLALIVGGSIGNLIDRLTLGYVVDFVAVGRFPVFNLADSCVTVSVILLLISMIIEERKAQSTEKSSEEDAQAQQ